MIGNNHNLVLNSLWAVLKEGLYIPEKIILLKNRNAECNKLEKQMRVILKEYDIDVDFVFARLEEGLPVNDDEMVLDITGGDNASVARLFLNSKTGSLKHIFMLQITDGVDPSTPYPLMNMCQTELIDILNDGVK